MYSYKINNSYTIYVNYDYINQCIKAGKKKRAAEIRAEEFAKSYAALVNGRKKVNKTTAAASHKHHKACAKKPEKVFTPLVAGTTVSHKVFGCGKVVSTDKNGIMVVTFRNKTTQFMYPEVMELGYLTLVK